MQNKIFWLVALLVVLVPTLPNLVGRGMFVDGVHYAALARNLAEGSAAVWAPACGKASWGVLPMQPLLASFFFGVFGDYFWVEKLFAGVVLMANLLALRWVWRLGAGAEIRQLGWWLVLLWGLFPEVGWGFANNILEGLVSLFGLIAFGLIIKAFEGGRGYISAILAGMCCGAAVLTKGPVALFHLGMPMAYVVAAGGRGLWKGVIYTAIMVGVLGVLGLGLSMYGPARVFFGHYFNEQIVGHIWGFEEGLAGSSGGKFPFTRVTPLGFLMSFAGQVWPALLAGGVVWWLARAKARAGIDKNRALFAGFVGVGASLPMIFSAKFSAFYLIPSAGFFAMAVGIASAPSVAALVALLPARWLGGLKIGVGIAYIGLIITAICLWGKPSRDRKELANVEIIAKLAYGQTIKASPELYNAYPVYTWLNRHAKISLDTAAGRYWIGLGHETPPVDYVRLELGLKDIAIAVEN